MRFQGAGLLAFVCVLTAAPVGSAEDAATPQTDFSVLTPAMAGKFAVASGFDGSSIFPYIGDAYEVAKDYSHRAQSERLRRLVAAENYDATRTLGDRLIEALGEAGHVAVIEPIARKKAGSEQSLSWAICPHR